MFTCSGTCTPALPSFIPNYKAADLIKYTSVFSINDDTLTDFVHAIRRPLFLGILDFLNELPPRACQSVMDDLENYGILDMISVQ